MVVVVGGGGGVGGSRRAGMILQLIDQPAVCQPPPGHASPHLSRRTALHK